MRGSPAHACGIVAVAVWCRQVECHCLSQACFFVLLGLQAGTPLCHRQISIAHWPQPSTVVSQEGVERAGPGRSLCLVLKSGVS